MTNNETVGIVQAGLNGPVAETFRSIVRRPGFPFKLEAIATASHPEVAGFTLKKSGLYCPPGLEDVPIISMYDAINNTDSPAVFSSLQDEAAAEYEDQLATGRVLATNAAANRMRPDVALLNAYFNGYQLHELMAEDRPGYIIANGNCMAIILSLPLSPLHLEIGLKSLKVETLQGHSGAGRKEVPEAERGEIIPINTDEKQKIESEPNKFLGSLAVPADIDITAKPNRGPWVLGHHARVVAKLDRPTTRDEVEILWNTLQRPEALSRIVYGPNSPRRWPIRVTHNDLLLHHGSDGSPRLRRTYPMRVKAHLIEVGGENQDEITFEVSGNNLVLGAAGSGAKNLVLAKQKGYIK